MFYALALAALAAVPGQGESLKLTNVRMTYGELGPTRPNNKFLPGDILFLAFDINGITIDKEGLAKFKMGTRVTDAKGKLIFKHDLKEIQHFAPLRGNVLPARAYIINGLDTEAGTYTLEVTVEDPAAKGKETATAMATVKFEITKRDFGIVGAYTSYDEAGAISAPTIGVVGQAMFVQFAVVGYDRDPKKKQPNIEFLYQFLDEKGTSLAEPLKQYLDKGIDEKQDQVPLRFPLYLNRPGKFTVKITATDKAANKTVIFELPVTILPAP